MHTAVRFHFTQLVIPLLWVLHCGFVKRVESGRSVNSNLPWNRGMPWWPREAQSTSQRGEPGSAAGPGALSEGIFDVGSCLAGMAALLHGPTGSTSPRLHHCELVLASVSLQGEPLLCLWMCCGVVLPPTAPIWSPCPCAPWGVSHTASVHGKNFSLWFLKA